MASFSIFCFRIGSIFWPSRIGWEAPVLVPGAMAAMSADSRMKNPAEAARLPEGATYTMTGTSDSSMAVTMTRVEVSSPPGVPSSINTACA